MIQPSMAAQINALTWYHTIELGPGLTTPGIYDHRPYLPAYGLPRDLTGKSVLDVGAASGFFTFELEKRGAHVTATDLPEWSAHDLGPLYKPELSPEGLHAYLHDPFLLARKMLGSVADRRLVNIYDLAPETVGTYDLVFCGSVLVHLTDPVKALWRLRSVTREAAIICTVIHPVASPDRLAVFGGHERGDGWWFPNRAAFEAMVRSAGFTGYEWFSEFRLDFRDGRPGPYHGVIRAWTTPERPAILAVTDHHTLPPLKVRTKEDLELEDLRARVETYERTRFFRAVRWLHPYRQRLRALLRQG